MENENQELVNRALYKHMEETHPIDYDSLRADLSKIKGIGESRLNEIMTVIDNHININDDT